MLNVYNQPNPPVINALQIGNVAGADLVVRSTTNDRKGRVLLDENTHTHSTIAGALCVPYGGVGVGGNVVVGGYNVMTPLGFSVTGCYMLAAGSGYSVVIGSGGTGVTGIPTVTFSVPDIQTGITATGVAQVSGGTIIGITITTPGSGYLKAPSVTFGGTAVGSGAVANAILGTVSSLNGGSLIQTGYVQSISVTTAGSGYTAIPQVFITPPDLAAGRQAVAFAIMASSTTVGSVVVTDPGAGYLYPPVITFSFGNAVAVAAIANPGTKSIVTQVPTTLSAYTLDFSLLGHNTVYITSASAFTINFSATNGFPIGRQINVYFKSTGATSLTLTGFTAANSSTGSATMTLTNARTTKFEFNVLTNGNGLSDVFVTQTG